jgi:hypothetical protein
MSLLTNIFPSLEILVLLAWKYLESVGTEVVALSLQQVSGYYLTPVSVEEGQSSAESGRWDTPEDSLSDYASPARLGGVDSCRKK